MLSTPRPRLSRTILKTGRTHLQDAVPITLGQEFGGFAANVRHAAEEVDRTSGQLLELNLGASAVGTGLNAGDDYTREAVERSRVHRRAVPSGGESIPGHAKHGGRARVFGCRSSSRGGGRKGRIGPAPAQHGAARRHRRDPAPPVQPGSSIMPGKVNPSVPEMVNQVCYQVIGCDAAILARCDAGQLELNVMMPVMAWNALHAPRSSRRRCVSCRRGVSKASRPTRRVAASCSTEAPRWRPR